MGECQRGTSEGKCRYSNWLCLVTGQTMHERLDTDRAWARACVRRTTCSIVSQDQQRQRRRRRRRPTT